LGQLSVKSMLAFAATGMQLGPIMLRFLSLLSLSACTLLAQQPGTGALTNHRVMELTKSGITENELVRLIATASDVSFDLTPDAENTMLKAGVSENIIKAMAARETNNPPAASSALLQPAASYPVVKRKHAVRKWVIIGAICAGAAFAGYWASNPSAAAAPQVIFH
jgi:hypothetical protein